MNQNRPALTMPTDRTPSATEERLLNEGENMRHKVSVMSIAIVLGGGLLLIAADQRGRGGSQEPAGAQQGQVLLNRKGLPLAALVKPGAAAEVVVQKDQAPPLFVEPAEGTPWLEWTSKQTPYVFVGTVLSTTSSLTPDKDWVTSAVQVRIDEVLKKSNRALDVGQTIGFQQDGGNVLLGATMVRAVVSWVDNFEEGQRYILFADGPSEGSNDWEVLNHSSYKIGPDGSLKSMAKQGRAAAEGAGLSHAAAISRIRSVVKEALK